MSVPVLDYCTLCSSTCIINKKKHAYHKVCILAQLCGLEETCVEGHQTTEA